LMPVPAEFQQRLRLIEGLVTSIESLADPSLCAQVRELMSLTMELHGVALERLLEVIHAGENGGALIDKLGRDELVSSLLVLYGLHPLGLEARVALALEKAHPRLRANEGEVEFVSLDEGALKVKLHTNRHGCGSTAQALEEVVRDAIYQMAPDVTGLVIERASEGTVDKQSFVPLEMLRATTPALHVSSGFLSSVAGGK